MKQSETTVQVNIDWRVITIALVLVLLAAGAWSANASPATQNNGQAGGLDANLAQLDATAAPAGQPAPSGDANAALETIDQAQQPVDLPAGLDANGAAAAESSDFNDFEALEAISGSANGKLFYLTNFSVNGASPKTACAAGYHMASMWEIYDLSNLTYNYSHPSAFNKADSGSGPPARWYGWVRTGFDSSTAANAGIGNCSNYAQNTTGSGTIVRINYDWDTSLSAIHPWEPDPWSCAGVVPVWCVGD